MRTLIIPCAGLSTRYTSSIPKYLLTHPSGRIMAYESIQGLPLNEFDSIIMVVLRKHMVFDTYHKILVEFYNFPNFEIVTLENETTSASDTVSQCIKLNNIHGEIYVKDVDDYFQVTNISPNQICTFSLNNSINITPGNKSYVKQNKNNEVISIIEKEVISPDFCCGLYSFDSADEFVKTYKEIERSTIGEIYISHVIYQMLLNGKTFTTNEVQTFIDWGTQKDWDNFKSEYNG
jgi:hypothetical protein